MSQVARLARFRIDPAARDELLAAYAVYRAAVRDEHGVLVWELCSSVEDENEFWLFIRAADAAVLEAHRSTAAVADLGALLLPALAGSPEFHDLVPQFSIVP